MIRATLFTIGLLALAAGGLAPASADAQRGYDATIRDAITEYQAGNLAEARALFMQAHALSPSAKTLRGLGMVAFEQKRYVEAADLLRQGLDDERKALRRRARADTEQLLARAEAFVGRFRVTTTPATAQVEVDGKPATPVDGVLRLQIGPHTLTASAAGHQPWTQTLEVSGAEDAVLNVELQPEAPAPAPAVATPPPPAAVAVAPAPGLEPAPAPSPVAAPAAATRTGSTLLPTLLISAGVVALAAGSVAGGFASARAKHVEDNCPARRCDEPGLVDDADSAETLALTATVLWVAGGALAATGLGIWLFGGDDGQPETAATARPAPMLGRDLAGLQLQGSF